MKEVTFKDIAHLYLGCRVLINGVDKEDYEEEIDNGLTDGTVANLTLVNEGICQLSGCSDNESWEWAIEAEGYYMCGWWNGKPFKPILRRLDSLTEDEAFELVMTTGHFYLTKEKFELFTIDGKGFCWGDGTMWHGDGVSEVNEWHLHFSELSAMQFTYLLGKCFDLFNLIPRGLAIDAESLKTT